MEEEEYNPFMRSDNLPAKSEEPTATTTTTTSSNNSYPTTSDDNSNTTNTVEQSPLSLNTDTTTTTTTTASSQPAKPAVAKKKKQASAATAPAVQDPPVIKKPEWVPDSFSNSCEMCQTPFTFFNRRHHCRRCGHLFCAECCSLNVSLPQEFGYTERVKVCSKCFTVTLNDRAREETTVTINIGGVSKETKVVSGIHKVLLWKMGAHEDGDFDRTVIDSLENYPSNAIPVSRVQDLSIDSSDLDVQGCKGFRVRIYNPALELNEKPGIFPILMWFHTGGFVSKSIETPSVDGLCRLLSNQARCVVVSVDYRLAPENQFPCATLDCFAATCWAVKKAATFDGDPSRVVVAGDSVGGNLAAAVALMARDKETPNLLGQVLIYPILDLKRNEDKYYTRIVHNDGYLMPMSYFKWFSSKYCKETDVENPYASPIRAAATSKSLTGLPPTLVLTAGQDPFCDEGELYVKKLRSAGVKTNHTRYTNSPHGFFAVGLDESNEAVMEVSIALKYMFRRQFTSSPSISSTSSSLSSSTS
ncbi:hypothetical protein CYY_004759 [Polysphondylium violaceum]|uniref:FYVE-type domain-containing protein n=1 Tax=Polysphondylium violaceum TaxID=133409 RepID=A0A8J4UZ22_9MYCE|nr:hypothetical protein CYY_004759 [Polysphondylium violaceum]